VTYLGPVAIWQIAKPRGPRLSLWRAMFGWFVGLPLTAATMLWNWAESQPMWPFGRRLDSAGEIVLRYELILLVCLAYITLLSLPAWWRHRRLARQDAVAIDAAIREQRWEQAALLVHRYCLLVSAVWRRVPARVATWDALLRPRLPRHRRLYVYFRKTPPVIPTDAAASFTPVVIPPPHPPTWAAIALIPVGLMLYLLVMDILRKGYWQRVLLFNAVLLALILVGYGFYFFAALMGRSHYFRFAPGAIQLLQFTLFRRRPLIESFELRRIDIVLDLSAAWPGVTLLNTPGYRRETFRLPKGPEVIEALLRAALSTAPSPPLSKEHLVA